MIVSGIKSLITYICRIRLSISELREASLVQATYIRKIGKTEAEASAQRRLMCVVKCDDLQ